MAVKRSAKKSNKPLVAKKQVGKISWEPEVEGEIEDGEVGQAGEGEGGSRWQKFKGRGRVWFWGGMIVFLAVAWWWKTNTWPVVAVVGGRVLTRFEVDQELYRQNGVAMVESLITQKLVERELKDRGIQVDKAEVEARLEEMKSSLGAGVDWTTELQRRGFTEAQIRQLVELQLGVNKAVEDQASVSAEEVGAYVKENEAFLKGSTMGEKTDEARNILLQDKLQTAIGDWVSEVRAKGNVWMWPGMGQVPAGGI